MSSTRQTSLQIFLNFGTCMYPKGPFIKGLVHLVPSMILLGSCGFFKMLGLVWGSRVFVSALTGDIGPQCSLSFPPSLPPLPSLSLFLSPFLSLFFSLSLDPPSVALLEHGTSYHDALQTQKQWYGVSMSGLWGHPSKQTFPIINWSQVFHQVKGKLTIILLRGKISAVVFFLFLWVLYF